MPELSSLSEIVGAAHIWDAETASACRVGGVAPRAAVAPGDRSEVAQVIARAGEARWAAVPFGGGTKIELGNPPSRLDFILSTHRLNRVVDYQPDDMTVTLEPGVTLETLSTLLAQHGQFLPLDPPLADRATVGGTIAAAATGPWRAGFGTPRDWLIGCRVVGADAKEVRGGGQVVKNVAGYDLPKLYTGSFGTLGVLTELTFKVQPKPAAAGYGGLLLADASQAEAVLAAVLDSDLQPTVLELVSAAALTAAGFAPVAAPWLLFAQFMHVSDAVAWQRDAMRGLGVGLGAEWTTFPHGSGDAVLAALRDAPGRAAAHARIGTVSSKVAALAAAVIECGHLHGIDPLVSAHAATGQVNVCYSTEPERTVCDGIRALARAEGASCVFPRVPQALVGQLDVWGDPGAEIGLLRGIKAILDPTGLFSPGRFVAGL